jgi:hypothetical protein
LLFILLYSNICALLDHEYKWIQAMTINYITLQSKCETLFLDFLQSDLSVWRKPGVWMLRFGGFMVLWLWMITFFAAVLGHVPIEQLGPIWFSFVGIEVPAPWAGFLCLMLGEGLPVTSVWIVRIVALVSLVHAIWLAKLLAGPNLDWPLRRDCFAYGGHITDYASGAKGHGHIGTSGVIVGHIKGLPWQKSQRLVRSDPGTDCLVLGEGAVATNMFQAALKSFEGGVIRIGTDRLHDGLVAQGDIIRIAPGVAASCPVDPLRQVRDGPLAWFDVRAMLYPCCYNERQLVLATALLVHALETAEPHRRTLADVVVASDEAPAIYARLNGWIDKTPLLVDPSHDQLRGLLDHWAQVPGQLVDDLALVRKSLWAVQQGWHCSTLGEAVQSIADIFTTGPRVASFEIKPRFPSEGLDPTSLPLMQLTALLRTLVGASPDDTRCPVLIAIEADVPKEVAWFVKAVRPQLKTCGVSLLVHSKSASAVKDAFGIHANSWLSDTFDTIILSEPDVLTWKYTLDVGRITLAALKSVRKGEVALVAKGKRPLRLHPADPAMVPILPSAPRLGQHKTSEPWGEAATCYPNGPALPETKRIKIVAQRAKISKASNAVEASQTRDDVRAQTPQSQPLVTKDDMASSTARLKRALTKRSATTPTTKPRTI